MLFIDIQKPLTNAKNIMIQSKELSYLNYWEVNNLYRWVVSQKLPMKGFKWVEDFAEFNESYIRSYNEESDNACFLEVDVQYPGNLDNLHKGLLFLPGRMKIKSFEKIVANLHDEEEYVVRLRNLKQALNHRLVLKKCH